MSNYSNKGRYTFEITATQACNFKCDYCFENKNNEIKENLISKNIEIVISKIDNVINNKWFKEKIKTTDITFWGGEPSLNIDLIERVVEYFVYNKNVTFYIYTNGSRIKELLPILKKCRSVSKDKFRVQVSYDGKELQDLRRKLGFKSDKKSSEIVLEGIELLHLNKIDFGLKSTITYKDFYLLNKTWDEFEELFYKYNIKLPLTVDYHNLEFYKYREDVEKTLLKIAKKEINFFRKNGIYLSNIFNSRRRFCDCGKGITTIDVDGKLYYCHGCLYSNKIHEFGNIFKDDLLRKIKGNYNYFFETVNPKPECTKCIALTCLKCNVKKYEESKKENFLERWHDYTSQNELCEYYKLCGRIGRAIINLLEGDK